MQRCVREFLDRAERGVIHVISACAGQGSDLLGVLVDHPRRDDVRARLVELDPRNVEVAGAAAAAAGLTDVDVVHGDASTTSAYEGAVPADLVLFCGVWGNVSDADVQRSIALLPTLCAPGATVVWTRHPKPPDLTVEIRRWLSEQGFEELSFDAPEGLGVAVGSHRLATSPRSYEPGVRLFSFFDA